MNKTGAEVIPFLSNAKQRKEGNDMTKHGKRALLAAGILAGAAAMTAPISMRLAA